MRTLLTSHVPLGDIDSRWDIGQLATGLKSAGHEPHVLIVDNSARRNELYPVRRIVCRAGDPDALLAFDSPCFSPDGPGRISFAELTDDELSRYRDLLRRELDDEVARFNPHLIHADSVWIWGHLALETGAPYVLSASSLELRARDADHRLRRFADEAAENASRILVADEAMRAEVLDTFDVPTARVVTVQPGSIREIASVYRDILRERYGSDPAW